MSLIKSISGIRGTIGGSIEEGLNPISIARFTAAYASFIKSTCKTARARIVVGRDARISGPMVKQIVVGTLSAMGCDVIDIDLATTPTTEMAVTAYKADGGIILTASHNPIQWNALKLLRADGEFLNDQEGKEVLRLAEEEKFTFAEAQNLGEVIEEENFIHKHVEEILKLNAVDIEAIRSADFCVAADCINSVGGVALPVLFEALGVRKVKLINGIPDGKFAHTPEPIIENLITTCQAMKEAAVDVGFIVDPDVDRLAIVDENGELIGEEYTLVAVADYLLALNGGGNTVSNLSSTRALADITLKYGGKYATAAVGEVNVTTKMKATDALIGGEGNGGVIYPALHYGRDALVGIALFLSYLAKKKMTVSALRKTFPNYYMSKQKVALSQEKSPDQILQLIFNKYKELSPNTEDGVKIDFPDKWVHIRKSNTEPIIRIYTEAQSMKAAEDLAAEFQTIIASL